MEKESYKSSLKIKVILTKEELKSHGKRILQKLTKNKSYFNKRRTKITWKKNLTKAH